MTAGLQDESRYTALSYVWGDLSALRIILINSMALSITQNLVSALGYIRKHIASGLLSEELPQLFWIDAICIYVSRQQVSCRRFGGFIRRISFGHGITFPLSSSLALTYSQLVSRRPVRLCSVEWRRTDEIYGNLYLNSYT
jgi:Heterokaryon incompatibility protein (HET)